MDNEANTAAGDVWEDRLNALAGEDIPNLLEIARRAGVKRLILYPDGCLQTVEFFLPTESTKCLPLT